MKTIAKIGIGVLSCAVVGIAAFCVRHLVRDTSNPPYNLGAFDVKWADFTETGVYTQDWASSYDCVGFERDEIICQWRKYENAEGDIIAIDEQNRICVFERHSDREHTATKKLSELSLQTTAKKAAANVLKNASQFEVDHIQTNLYGNDQAMVQLMRDGQRSFKANDYAYLVLDMDGYIDSFSVSYRDIPDDFTPTELDARFESYCAEIVPTLYRDFIRCEETHATYFQHNGVMYGRYSCDVAFGDADMPVYDVVAVVLRAE